MDEGEIERATAHQREDTQRHAQKLKTHKGVASYHLYDGGNVMGVSSKS